MQKTGAFMTSKEDKNKSRGGTKEEYLGVEVATDSLLSPRLVVKLCSSLLFWVPDHISHCLSTERSHLVILKGQKCLLKVKTGTLF